MIVKVRIFIPLLFVTIQALAQQPCEVRFSGRILDENNEPLIGATILLQPGNVGQIADMEGKFVFTGICPRSYTVLVQYMGYVTQQFTLNLDRDVIRKIFLKEEINTLEEIVIEDKSEEIQHAQNYSSLNEKQLTALAGKSLGETLLSVSGVNSIQAGPGIFKPVIHGVHSQRVLILNYGIRQEGQQWGAEHAPEIDPFIASEITVIKDASAIKYGTDALGGVVVVNPAPLPVKNVLGGSLSTVLQTNGRSGTVSGMVEGGIRHHNGWGWRAQGTLKRAGDYQTPTYNLTNTGVVESDFSLAAGYHADRGGVEVFFSHFKTELGILKGTSVSTIDDLLYAMERNPPQYTSGFSYAIEEPRQVVSHNLLKLNSHYQTDKSEWRVQYGFQQDHRQEFDIRRGSLSSTPAIDLQLFTNTLDAEWESRQHDKNSLCVGLSGMMQINSNVPGTKRIPFIPDFENVSGGVFGVSAWNFETWTADVGLRYDYKYYHVSGYDYKNALYRDNLEFHNVSASAGATFQVKVNQSLAVNVSTAWRPPHVAELYSQGTHQSAASIEYGLLLNDSSNEVMRIRDVSFKNEQALKAVATYRYQKDRLRVEVSPFANYIFNYIYLRATGVTTNVRGVYPYFRYTQTDVFFTGADIVAEWTACRNLKVSPKVSLLRAADTRNDDYLINIPSNRYEISLRYDVLKRFFFKEFFVESDLKFTPRQNRAPRVISVRQLIEAQQQGIDLFAEDDSNFDFMKPPAAWFLWKAATGFSVKSKKVNYEFRFTAENLLNTTYREYTNRFRYYANELGRNFTFSMRCVF